jgi:hypothetical protein
MGIPGGAEVMSVLALSNPVRIFGAVVLGQRATTTTTTSPSELFPRTSGWILAAVFALIVVTLVAGAIFKVKERQARRRVMNWDEEERISRQWEFLQKLYDRTGGQPRYKVKTRELMKQLGWELEATYAVRDRLADGKMLRSSFRSPRKILENMGFVKESNSDPEEDPWSTEFLHITQLGAEQVRTMQGSPGAAYALNRQVVQISGGVHVRDHSFIQIGDGTAIIQDNSVNTANISNALEAFERALAGPGLDPNTAEKARAYLRTARAELASPTPDQEMLKRLLGRMRDIAISAAGSGLWAGVAALFEKLVTQS